MIKRFTYRARALGALAAALAIVVVSLLAGASPASADDGPYPAPSADDGPHCNHDRRFNACLSFDGREFNFYQDAYVGIDVYMPEQSARDIVACGADFKATLRGDDGKGVGKDDHNPVIRYLVLQDGWPITDSTGIAAEFMADDVSDAELDEDDSDPDDEIYARVSFYNCITGQTEYFNTGYIVR